MVSYVKEYLTAISINVAALAAGCLFGGIFHTVISMKSSDDFVSAISLAKPIQSFGIVSGSVIAFIMLNSVGRKKTIMLVAITTLTSCILIVVANSYVYLISISYFQGVTEGLLNTVVPIYISEIASDKIRGSLGSFLPLMLQIGLISTLLIRPYISYQLLSYICMLLPIFLGLTYLWIPETPTYYLMQHREVDAKVSLKFLRNKRTESELNLELESLRTSVAEDENKSKRLSELWRTVGNRKAMLIMMISMIARNLSGISINLLAHPKVFDSGNSNALSNNVSIPICMLVAIVLTLITVDWIGRRKLLLGSTIGLVLGNLASAGYLFMKSNDIQTYAPILWIPFPTFLMILTIICSNTGFITIPIILLGELFPNNIKQLAALLVVLFIAGIMTIDLQLLLELFDFKYIFVLNSAVMFIVFIVIYIFLPETKGKSLDEIQLILNNKSRESDVGSCNLERRDEDYPL